MVISLILSAVIVGLDQLTKALLYGKSFSLLGNFLWIESTLNSGASFGMMSGSTTFFIIMTIPIAAAMIYIICSKKYLNLFNKICLGLILGGTIGNLIDRLIFSGVRDFIYFKSINFAIFNVADIAITIGTIMFIVGLILQVFVFKKASKNENSKEDLQNTNEDSDKTESLKAIRDALKESKDKGDNSGTEDSSN